MAARAWQAAASEGDILFFQNTEQTQIKKMKDEDNRTPVHYAATATTQNAQEVIRSMCARIGTRNALLTADEAGWMPLHCACSAGRAENVSVMMAFILEEKDDTDIAEEILLARTDNGGIPLHYAASKGHELVVDKLFADHASDDRCLGLG